MIALGMLLVTLGYVILAVFSAWLASRFFQSPRAKAACSVLILLVFALIPTWDIVPARLYFRNLCETSAGTKVYATAQDVVGFRLLPGARIHTRAIGELGYEFIEAGSPDGGYVRYTFHAGEARTEQIEKPTATFALEQRTKDMLFKIKWTQERIISLQTGKVMAERNVFRFSGGWLQRRPYLGFAVARYCPRGFWTDAAARDFYVHVLVPISRSVHR
jgi:hypothetical protein